MQSLIFKSREGWGAARLVSVLESYAKVQRFKGDGGGRNDGRRRFKGDEVSNGTGGGRAAKRAVLEMGVRSRMMMHMLRRQLHRGRRGTQLQ